MLNRTAAFAGGTRRRGASSLRPRISLSAEPSRAFPDANRAPSRPRATRAKRSSVAVRSYTRGSSLSRFALSLSSLLFALRPFSLAPASSLPPFDNAAASRFAPATRAVFRARGQLAKGSITMGKLAARLRSRTNARARFGRRCRMRRRIRDVPRPSASRAVSVDGSSARLGGARVRSPSH